MLRRYGRQSLARRAIAFPLFERQCGRIKTLTSAVVSPTGSQKATTSALVII